MPISRLLGICNMEENTFYLTQQGCTLIKHIFKCLQRLSSPVSLTDMSWDDNNILRPKESGHLP